MMRRPALFTTVAVALLLLSGSRNGLHRSVQGAGASRDSILADARLLSGESGFGPASRVARRPSTAAYAEYLRDRLADAVAPWGGSVALETFDPGFEDAPIEPVRTPFTNVVARIPGSLGPGAPGYFLLGAHFDATSQGDGGDPEWTPLGSDAPGADDNASGVAAVLEALRILSARGARPEADVLVVFFDGEEVQPVYDAQAGKFVLSDRSRLGSTHLADSLAQAGDRIYGVVVADMVAYNPRRDSLVVVTNIPSRWLADSITGAQADSNATGLGAGLDLTRLVRGLSFSDHGPFWEKGYSATLLIEAAFIDRHAPHYHRASDRVAATYSREGRQAAKAAEILAGLVLSWSRPASEAEPSLVVTGEDILVQDSIAVDLAWVPVGKPVRVRVGVTNRGGTGDGAWSVGLDIEDLGGRFRRALGTRPSSEPLPSGARVVVAFEWTPGPEDAGAVRLAVRGVDGQGRAFDGFRVVGVEGGSGGVAEAFVYPNPTREPETAMLRYALTRAGPVRVEILNLRAEPLALWEPPFDDVRPGGEVDVGVADVPLRTVLGGIPLAPGLYLARIHLFSPEGESVDVAVSRFAVLR